MIGNVIASSSAGWEEAKSLLAALGQNSDALDALHIAANDARQARKDADETIVRADDERKALATERDALRLETEDLKAEKIVVENKRRELITMVRDVNVREVGLKKETQAFADTQRVVGCETERLTLWAVSLAAEQAKLNDAKLDLTARINRLQSFVP